MRKSLTLAAMLVSCFLVGIAKAAEPIGNDVQSGIAVDNISQSLAPGSDFYEYANEKWLQTTQIPADQSNYGSFSELDDGVKEAIRTLIEEAAKNQAPAGTDEQRVGDFYRSYTDVETRNQLGTKPAQPLLAEVATIVDSSSLGKVAASLFRKGIVGPFVGYISPDAKQSDQYTVYVTQSGITLPDRDYYLEDKPQYVEARHQLVVYIADMLTTFGDADPQAAAERILELETQLIQFLRWLRHCRPRTDTTKESNSEKKSEWFHHNGTGGCLKVRVRKAPVKTITPVFHPTSLPNLEKAR